MYEKIITFWCDIHYISSMKRNITDWSYTNVLCCSVLFVIASAWYPVRCTVHNAHTTDKHLTLTNKIKQNNFGYDWMGNEINIRDLRGRIRRTAVYTIYILHTLIVFNSPREIRLLELCRSQFHTLTAVYNHALIHGIS